ncbi:MAG: glutamate--tRNA ligase family protein [Terrimicrobiaceae bacterium]|nr:glutamate--tRNA ligase family protein [Terrimicrobiaceae bacterium]
MSAYRGRIAPTPTGLLHAGHAATFRTAHARAAGGHLILRVEDLDPQRCREEFTEACIEDLRWLGITWDEGPLRQSARREIFLDAWRRLRGGGFIYPSPQSRRDVELAAQAPHEEEPIFPAEWRQPAEAAMEWTAPAGTNWRFRVPDGEALVFFDGRCGRVERVAGRDFGDFVIWRRDDVPAYELAVVADDIAMRITEVVRGEDLLTSTARQLLLHRALGAAPPAFFHCPLIRDAQGRRLSKRDAALGIRALREAGVPPENITKHQERTAPPARS